MFNIGMPELITMTAWLIPLVALFFIIKYAVKSARKAALKEHEREKERR